MTDTPNSPEAARAELVERLRELQTWLEAAKQAASSTINLGRPEAAVLAAIGLYTAYRATLGKLDPILAADDLLSQPPAEGARPTCATCQHFRSTANKKRYPAANAGVCTNVRLSHEEDDEEVLMSVWELFGCTLHEPKEPSR